MYKEKFETRHIGPQASDVSAMLKVIGDKSIDELIDKTVPKNIRLKASLNISDPLTEFNYLSELKTIANKNKVFKSYIGMGYYNCIIPPVIQRNVLENPGWYTAYTPYQAEIAQGRLEALLNFQTMVSDLTGLEIANASLLDEATAAAEGMIMFFHNRTREAIKNSTNKFFVSELCFPQTIDVLKTRALPLGIELIVGNHQTQTFDATYFGALLQYPAGNGEIYNYTSLTNQLHEKAIKVAVATDLMSLVLLTPPGEWGADVVVGNSQRFGVPMGYGGPHAAFFATTDEFKRNIPGRIIGVSKDKLGNAAMRMALQTREQHIRRDKATSNICTAQALLAVMASMYAVYHGAEGLKKIATDIHQNTVRLSNELKKQGFTIESQNYFDTIVIAGVDKKKVKEIAEKYSINFRYFDNNNVSISLDETVSEKDIQNIIIVFCEAAGKKINVAEINLNGSPSALHTDLKRNSSFLTNSIFNKFHSETEMMRYMKRLENKDLSLVHSMIALGSCTMKLNSASELMPITWPEFANIHPFVPIEQTEGYQQIFTELKKDLCEITGFDGFSLQPNSGAQGEYSGLMVIRNYHLSRGEGHRNIALIPSSAHGTNPASAVMAGMEVVVTKCDEKGNIDLADLQAKIDQHKNNISCLMVTYPSTHGVFEAAITEITKMVHAVGGQVYMDGANMNAQVGLTSPGNIGADVCHLNLHKTFAIPHGGGGPGMGPIGVKKHLIPFLSGHSVVSNGDKESAVSAAPWGSSLILLISYGYIKMLGAEGITNATKFAILNANYIKHRLDGWYDVLYQGENKTVAHEMILDCRSFKTNAGVEVEDIAKRLMDYGFHAPTVSFPVAGTIMIEPTESESKEELDRFCEAMIQINKEIKEIETGKADKADNVLKHAPHTVIEVMDDHWNHSYSRSKAAFPLPYIKEAKFWPSVSRIDNAFGDRNLICTCPSVESYATEVVS